MNSCSTKRVSTLSKLSCLNTLPNWFPHSINDDNDGSAGEEELADLVERLYKATTAYGMEISAEKTKLMTNNTSGINTESKVNGQKLETDTSFKYLGSVITDEGSKPEILQDSTDNSSSDKAETSLE